MSLWRSMALKSPDFGSTAKLLNVRGCHHETFSRKEIYQKKIGNREIVGFGLTGEPSYIDWHSFPFPSIRFRKFGPELKALREKEKGDWRTLTSDEKKCLYRASFCSTFAEMDAPDPEWKSVAGWTMFMMSLGVWLYVFTQLFVRREAPKTFDREHRIAQYYRAVAINHNPFATNIRPPGAEKRVHPKNKEMLEEIMKKEARKEASK
ncbi:cytochrome c oxidase subunit 4 isoform 1, mitochondrial-like [Belonocnema kinseyi]|uniref:cytochrome c oxidase subunit 4 isoform 1, mitochondrial-like n=1 Tax=Belonocnema kinseyi TaxID=2817044 RepID=UPI00143D990C|nr:cytochrome c oxidase subunit 4 isoform 1, mitochondrial-like [Belonocnema kinseyi]